ncbi:MAG: FHA domain-containing protein [Xanthomonadales bacterium]|nr:FHA domain-containing protein [Xanthomonadales bacterium]
MNGPHAAHPPDSGQAALVIIRGEPFGKAFEVGEEPLDIGRSRDCHIRFAENSVSRRHCQIWRTSNGYFWIEDLGADTRVNGDPIRQCRLRDGDRITVGSTVLEFLASDGQPSESEQEAPSLA